MLKKYSQLFSFVFFCVFSTFVATAAAIDLDEATRTVVVNGSGKTVLLTPEQVNVVNDYLMQLVVLVILVVLQRQTQT
jgi:hypothetical protein